MEKEYSFNTKMATEIGVEESIMLSALRNNEKRTTLKEIEALFPFWTSKQVRRITESLLAKDLLSKEKTNGSPFDQTKLYSPK